MSSHNSLHAMLHTVLEGSEIIDTPLGLRIGDNRETHMRVGINISVTGKVLDSCSDVIFLETLHVSNGHFANKRGIASKGTDTNNRIILVHIDINVGSEVKIHAQCAEFATMHSTAELCQRDVSGCPNGHVTRHLSSNAKASDKPSLLICPNQQRQIIASLLDVRGERIGL